MSETSYKIKTSYGQITISSLDVPWLSFDDPAQLEDFITALTNARDAAFGSAQRVPIQDVPRPKFTRCYIIARTYTHFKDWVARNGDSPFVLEKFGHALQQSNTRCVLNEDQLRGLDRDRILLLILPGTESMSIRRFPLADYFKHIAYANIS